MVGWSLSVSVLVMLVLGLVALILLLLLMLLLLLWLKLKLVDIVLRFCELQRKFSQDEFCVLKIGICFHFWSGQCAHTLTRHTGRIFFLTMDGLPLSEVTATRNLFAGSCVLRQEVLPAAASRAVTAHPATIGRHMHLPTPERLLDPFSSLPRVGPAKDFPAPQPRRKPRSDPTYDGTIFRLLGTVLANTPTPVLSSDV